MRRWLPIVLLLALLVLAAVLVLNSRRATADAPTSAPLAEVATKSVVTEEPLSIETGADERTARDPQPQADPAPEVARFEIPSFRLVELDSRVFGLVVAAATGEPIADATVLLRESGGNQAAWQAPTTTGADGRFELALASSTRPHLRVGAAGYATRLADPAGHDDPVHPLRVELSREATLVVVARDAAGGPVAGARIGLGASAYSLGAQPSGGSGFFMGERLSAPEERWVAETTADGRAILEGLPSGVELRARVDWLKGLRQLELSPLTLEPGERRELELVLRSGTRIAGLALDTQGEPLAGLEIFLAPCNIDPMVRVLTLEERQARARTTTDESGRFAFESVDAGCWRLAIQGEDVAMVPLRVETAGEPECAVTLRAFRGLHLTGVVLDPDGRAVADARVEAYAEEQMFWDDTRTDEQGRFRLGPVTTDTFTLLAYGRGGFAASDPQPARAGEPGTVLRLKRAGTLRGRVVDGANGLPRAAQVMYTPEQHTFGPFGSGAMLMTETDGSFVIGGLAPGRYGLSAMSADGRFGLLHGIEVSAGGETNGVELVLAPGGKLTLHHAGAAPRLFVSATQGGIPVHFGEVLARGSRTTVLVPAGELVLELRSDPLGAPRKLSTRVEAGATAEVEIGD